MFQCIIQQKNGWIHSHNTENKDVFPGLCYINLVFDFDMAKKQAINFLLFSF